MLTSCCRCCLLNSNGATTRWIPGFRTWEYESTDSGMGGASIGPCDEMSGTWPRAQPTQCCLCAKLNQFFCSTSCFFLLLRFHLLFPMCMACFLFFFLLFFHKHILCFVFYVGFFYSTLHVKWVKTQQPRMRFLAWVWMRMRMRFQSSAAVYSCVPHIWVLGFGFRWQGAPHTHTHIIPAS